MKFRSIAVLCATLLASGSIFAATATPAAPTAQIKANIERFTQGKVKVDDIRPTPAAGLYQVISDGEVFYTDASGRFGFVGGALIDMKSQTDLTSPAVDELTSVAWDKLPLKLAVKQVNGKGTRKMAVFEDPNCPVCRVFTKFIDQLDDVTIYRFMYPVISPASQEIARTAWCAADRDGAWKQAMAGERFAGRQDCDITGLADILKFGQEHKLDATPTVFLANGKRLVGATPPEQFIEALNASEQ